MARNIQLTSGQELKIDSIDDLQRLFELILETVVDHYLSKPVPGAGIYHLVQHQCWYELYFVMGQLKGFGEQVDVGLFESVFIEFWDNEITKVLDKIDLEDAEQ